MSSVLPGNQRPRPAWRGWFLPAALALFALMLGLSQASAVSARNKPFGSPFAMPPSPGAWHVSQWYGATAWSSRNWHGWYNAGQGLHFGIDLAAACGTPVVAIGDGVVFAVDGPYGAEPHSVVIRHANGYFSLYGHLVSRSTLQVGQRVNEGDQVGFVGDLEGPTCDRAPHLHLEIRYDGMRRATNPINLVDLEWEEAALGLHDSGTTFAVDLDRPDRWQTIYDQPDVFFSGPIFWAGSRIWPR